MTQLPDERRREITWRDPVDTAKHTLAMSSVDSLRAMRDGAIPWPPISSFIGMEFLSVDPGDVVMRSVPNESHNNPIGSVHGGWLVFPL